MICMNRWFFYRFDVNDDAATFEIGSKIILNQELMSRKDIESMQQIDSRSWTSSIQIGNPKNRWIFNRSIFRTIARLYGTFTAWKRR